MYRTIFVSPLKTQLRNRVILFNRMIKESNNDVARRLLTFKKDFFKTMVDFFDKSDRLTSTNYHFLIVFLPRDRELEYLWVNYINPDKRNPILEFYFNEYIDYVFYGGHLRHGE